MSALLDPRRALPAPKAPLMLAAGPLVATFDEFAASRGVGTMFQAADLSFIRSGGNTSTANLERAKRRTREALQATFAARDALRPEYAALTASGSVREPSRDERLIKTAQGHPDNPSVQAARRLLAKRGVDWQVSR